MGRLTTFTHVTLDGVMQAPGRRDEDTRGEFGFGGWEVRYGDEVMAAFAAEGMATNGAMLFGRRTYEDFHGFWPNQPRPNPFSDVLDASPKFVASTTLREPLPWANSTLLPGDAGESVARLKAESDVDIVVLGSGNLIRTLMRHRLIDEFHVLIHPLVLGNGQRLFGEGGPSTELRLVGTRTTTTGVVIATYRPAD